MYTLIDQTIYWPVALLVINILSTRPRDVERKKAGLQNLAFLASSKFPSQEWMPRKKFLWGILEEYIMPYSLSKEI